MLDYKKLVGLTHLKYKTNSSKLITFLNSNFNYDVSCSWFGIMSAQVLIRIKNNFIFAALYKLPDITACLYDTEGNLKLGYSVTYKTEEGRFIGYMNPSHQNVIIVQPNAENKIYLCEFLGSIVPGKPNYENCDKVLLLTNVGMNNYNYCDHAPEEDILRSEKIKILK
jgi:hypothetical protein